MKKITTKLLLTAILLTSTIFTSCYTWFEEKVQMDNTTTQIGLSDFVYEPKPITQLESPVQVVASQGTYSGTIKLRWNEVPYATSYRIERAVVQPDSNGVYPVPEEGDFSVLEKYVFNTFFNDYILADPKNDNAEYSNIYYYRISAENLIKGYEPSDFTDYKKAETSAVGWLLAPPQNIDAWKGKSSDIIKVSWEKVPNAKKYEIYRGEKANGLGMELLASVKANQTSFENQIDDSEKGQEFYYKTIAVIDSNSSSAATGLALGYSLKEGAPSAPTGVKVTNGLGESISDFKIEWDPIVKDGYNISYVVYRTSSVNSIFQTVKNGITDNKCTDSNKLQPGVTYYYYVQTIAKKGEGENEEIIKSGFSETGPSDPTPVKAYLLSSPTDIEILDSTDSDKVILRWTPAIGYSQQTIPYTYAIYSDTTKDGDYTTLELEDQLPALGEDGFYSIELTKKSFFKVATKNGDGLYSKKSSPVAPTPSAPTNVTASKTSLSSGLGSYSPNVNEVYPVKITWKAPQNESVYGYHVYRSNKPDSSFRKLTDAPITSDQELSFIDQNESARAGTYYYYKVVSLNVLGQGKKSNDPSIGSDARGYGAITRDQWFREYNKTIMKSQSKLTLMHKSNDTDKLGSETINGDISGTLSYNAAIAGLGAKITMPYTNYCDYYINNNKEFGPYFTLTGNTDTSSNMSGNGNMSGTVNCTGMYPGYAIYDHLEIKSKNAGGGYYLVQTKDLSGSVLLSEDKVDWMVGEEK